MQIFTHTGPLPNSMMLLRRFRCRESIALGCAVKLSDKLSESSVWTLSAGLYPTDVEGIAGLLRASAPVRDTFGGLPPFLGKEFVPEGLGLRRFQATGSRGNLGTRFGFEAGWFARLGVVSI